MNSELLKYLQFRLSFFGFLTMKSKKQVKQKTHTQVSTLSIVSDTSDDEKNDSGGASKLIKTFQRQFKEQKKTH